ncbi:Arc family DNA-binding protein [Rhizobium rhizogenes]|uniref:Arc family DNA-binding protein n=1 Tax=Rhizobium rhizogenes TaxID=359 RepID=UPI0015738E60|nr:Arc family DNA-binding protein [Rhizobium rhizogenes]NTF43088.1 Arc family DNA-binding protein [Rhizobium rhizogenes]
MAPPRQTDPQFKLRLTPGLKARIERAAEANNRSMNAEIIARLEESFDPLIADVRGGKDFMDALAEMSERIVRKIRKEEREEGLSPLAFDPPEDSAD